MADKNNNTEKKNRRILKNSLKDRVFRATTMGACVIALVALIIGAWMYGTSLADQYIVESLGLAKSAETIISKGTDVKSLVSEVMNIYNSLDESQREQTGSDAYRERFAKIMENENFLRTRSILHELVTSSDVRDLYLGMYLKEGNRLIYFCDSDDSEGKWFYPGEWEKVEEWEVNTFLNWDGKTELSDISDTKGYGWMCTSGSPVYDEDGNVFCFVLSDIMFSDFLKGMSSFLVRYLVAIVIATFIVAYLLIEHMQKNLVHPINQIATAAQEYIDDKRKGDVRKKHFSLLNIDTNDEIENLNEIMAGMENSLSDYERNLTRITKENERISTELELARKIQENMLPNTFPAFPDRNEFDLYASMDPAKKVGGDFYNYFLIDDDHLCLMIADVSGKGVPAALFMMASMIILANNAGQGLDPCEVMEKTNDLICRKNEEQMFVTAWLGILEISTGRLVASNAGHEFPIIRDPKGNYELMQDKHGFVLGGMEGLKYSQYEIQMKKGTSLFLYTDGLPEASDSVNNMFKTDRIVEVLNKDPEADPQSQIENMRTAVEEFVGEAEQFDDLTMMAFVYKGSGKEKGLKKKTK